MVVSHLFEADDCQQRCRLTDAAPKLQELGFDRASVAVAEQKPA